MEKLLCQRQLGLRTHDPLRPCRHRQGPGMKTPPRPLSQKRVAEGLKGSWGVCAEPGEPGGVSCGRQQTQRRSTPSSSDYEPP